MLVERTWAVLRWNTVAAPRYLLLEVMLDDFRKQAETAKVKLVLLPDGPILELTLTSDAQASGAFAHLTAALLGQEHYVCTGPRGARS